MLCRYFDTKRKGNHSSFLTAYPNVKIKNVGLTWMAKCNQLTPLSFKRLTLSWCSKFDFGLVSCGLGPLLSLINLVFFPWLSSSLRTKYNRDNFIRKRLLHVDLPILPNKIIRLVVSSQRRASEDHTAVYVRCRVAILSTCVCLGNAMVTCEIKVLWNNFEIISVFYFTSNHVWNYFKSTSATLNMLENIHELQ